MMVWDWIGTDEEEKKKIVISYVGGLALGLYSLIT